MSPGSCILILATLVWEREALRVQKLSIFTENCCKGKSEQYDANVRNLGDVSMTVNRGQMKSFSIHHGLWALSLGVNYSRDGIYYEGNNDDLNGNCGSSASAGGGDYIQYKSIRLVGNTYLDLPGLSFFTAQSFQGAELYFDGTNLRLPSPYVFKSYGFTAKDSWTVYPLTNFSGTATCLIAQNKPVSFVEKLPTFTVGSVQRGCSLKQNGRKSSPRSRIANPHGALILYRDVNNQNGDKLYTDALELRLPLALDFRSYTFAGTKNWTVFGGTDLSGQSVCLFNTNPKSPGHDKSKSPALLSMSIGSVRRGCDTDPVKEVVTALPEASEHQVDIAGAKPYLENSIVQLLAPLLLHVVNRLILPH